MTVLLALIATSDLKMSEVSHIGEKDRRSRPMDQIAR
jgi:hypothetical protein